MNKSVQFFGRLITAIVILGITAFFTPGFTYASAWILVTAIALLCVIDFLISLALFPHPILKAIIGFVISGVALYLIQFIVVGYTISWLSLLFGAILYGVVDYMLPSNYTTQKNKKED